MEDDEARSPSPPDLILSKTAAASHGAERPLPLRIYSGSELEPMIHRSPSDRRWQRKSTQTPSNLTQVPSWRDARSHLEHTKLTDGDCLHGSQHKGLFAVSLDHDMRQDVLPVESLASNLTPPVTPMADKASISQSNDQVEIFRYDFSKIDYEIDRATKIGEGLWSNVFLVQPKVQSSDVTLSAGLTPPTTPYSGSARPPCILFAVKQANGASAKTIFYQEAKILTKLQRSEECHKHVVPFYGLDERRAPLALVFEGIRDQSGRDPSLEGFVNSWTTMTEEARYMELRKFLVTIAHDLINGLRFIHANGVIHADIKAANILLDIHHTEGSSQQLSLQARYIDFSASFVCNGAAPNAGGTWAYMAPEQISSNKNLSKPTFVSDIWSLGITLLFIILGRSPWPSAYDNNLFWLRETIKQGEALKQALEDPANKKRIDDCQDFVDCCKPALRRDRGSRISAEAWLEVLAAAFPRV